MIGLYIECMPRNNFISIQYLCNNYLICPVVCIHGGKFDHFNKQTHMCVNIIFFERLHCYVISKRKADILVDINFFHRLTDQVKEEYTRFPIPTLCWSNISFNYFTIKIFTNVMVVYLGYI